jgi:hypothetical protein
VHCFSRYDSLKDWLIDFSFMEKEDSLSELRLQNSCARGFIDAYKNESIRGRIHGYLTRDIRRVRLTGHSYGAALAVLCAVDLQYNFPDRDYEVALFGCPRVGNGAFARSYNRRLFKTLRVENGNDIVTRVPPALLGYRHVGIPIRVGPVRLPGAISFLQHRPSDYYNPCGGVHDERRSRRSIDINPARCYIHNKDISNVDISETDIARRGVL